MTESNAAHDEQFMRRALELAKKGWGQTAPNPMVGAVVVRDGRIIGEGYHERFGEPHAEVNALRQAGDRAPGATMYVTLEPCRHHGKTPPCTEAILDSGVERVVIAVADPTALAGGGAGVLREMTLDVEIGLLEQEARELNAPFFHAVDSDLPWTMLKLAVSADTAIAHERGTSTWLTGPETHAMVHHLRAGQDAIAVGVGTILADDSQLTVRDVRPPRKPPARVVFDRKLRTPLRSKVVFTAREIPTILVTDSGNTSTPMAEEFRDAGVHLISARNLREAFRRLRGAGIRSMMVEGGAKIATAVLNEKLASRLVIFQAPVVLGPSALHAFDNAPPALLRALELLPVLERRTLGKDLMTMFALNGSTT